MAEDAIRIIEEAEKKADDLLAHYNLKARETVLKAEKEGKESRELAKAEAKREAAQIIEEAERCACRDMEEIMLEAERECGKISALAEERMEQAVSAIIKRIVYR